MRLSPTPTILNKMEFSPEHSGLYISTEQRETLRQDPPPEALRAAFDALAQGCPQPDDLLAVAVWDATRWLLRDDAAAAERALATLRAFLLNGQAAPAADGWLDCLWQLLSAAHALEMLRTYPPLAAELEDHLAGLAARAAALAAEMVAPEPLERLWWMLAQIVLGVVLEDAARFAEGAEAFHAAIHQIHPEGYLKALVQQADGYSYLRQTLGVAALVLAAEAAQRAGVNLWAYENRGVGVGTAAAYVVYYYFFPDKWRWEKGLTTEQTQAWARLYGAYLEILAQHSEPRGLPTLFEDMRPLFCAFGGGLSSLTHGLPRPPAPRHKRFGFF